MKQIISVFITAMAVTSVAEAASWKMYYYTGKNTAYITPLKDEAQCHKLAKQKRLDSDKYYCSTESSPDYKLERKLGWR